MRDIIFRGKVDDEPNEWVIGCLIIRGDNNYSIFQSKEHKGSKCCGFGTFGVRKETICQYTGLKDKNGTMIFEEDIVKSEYEMYNFYVKYEDCAFTMRTKWGNGLRMTQKIMDKQRVEVIGNIKDNPELLKEA